MRSATCNGNETVPVDRAKHSAIAAQQQGDEQTDLQ